MSKTNLAVSIETIGDKVRRYNEKVCNILADPQILAYILINTMDVRIWLRTSYLAILFDT